MIVKVTTDKFRKVPFSWEDTQSVEGDYGIEDAKRFLESRSSDDFVELMREYSSTLIGLYGPIEDDPDDFPFDDSTTFTLGDAKCKDTTSSYSNLSELMNRMVQLRDCQEATILERYSPYEYASLGLVEDAGIVVNGLDHTSDIAYFLTLLTDLDADESTEEFLESGVEHAASLGCSCRLVHPSEGPWGSRHMRLEIETRCFDTKHHHLHQAVEDLMDALTKVMLHDTVVGIRDNEICLAAGSIASSLWCAMLEAAQEGHVKRCKYCGKTIVALDERRPRLFCSQACNKSHQRMMKFKELVDGGMAEPEAARKVSRSLKSCKEWWAIHMLSDGSAKQGA